MSSVQCLREFMEQRLTAAAEEGNITAFEEQMVPGEESDDQEAHRADFPQQHVCKQEEVLTDQQLCHQEEAEPPQIKEEPEDLCISQEGEQLAVKEETDTFMMVQYNFNHEEKVFEKSIVQHEEGMKLHRTDLSQQHVYKEEEVLTDQERNQEEPELPQIKAEQEELGSSQEGELKEEADTFMVATYEESDLSEPEPNTDQFSTVDSPVPESQDQDGSKNVGSGSTRSRNAGHSNNAEDCALSETQYNTDTGKKSIKCDVCGKAFKKKYKLKEHHRVHTGEKPYSCETCGKSFYDSTSLKRHMAIHTGEKPYSCKTCGKSFTRSGTLTVHMRTHTGERPYPCKTCGKMFTCSSHLLAHARTHTGEKPYHCKTCGKMFTYSSHLLAHARTHTGEKPYHCKTCGKTFTYRTPLLEHIRTHTGEKPYHCKTCGKQFTRSSHLLAHIRTHTGEKSYCDVCGKMFTRNSNLWRHMKTHTGQKSKS